ncbi:twin-arginine translocase subunit TatC [Leifsonia sp. Leaf264]|uniref:twin-arginine translocase subunit TatC n=1 Tax=Leifsonia sp. Leaf264 TaxID=1736314 RepID=UPI0006F36BA0|nr:twin-arginine translocase subunit TatC [Leifsonia sp. Leaf264]KQP01075.1 preprotein translocase subunit TatC [Leifsonia sp. Leaf264]
MSLGQHLLELRKRLFLAAGGIVVGAIVGWFLSDFVWNALRVPVIQIVKAQHRNAVINYPDITSAFDLKLQIAFYIGIVISSPMWLYQIFAFFMPALSRTEKQYTFGFFFTAIPLFLAGCAAGWYVLPHVVDLMTSFAPPDDAAFINAKDYFQFVLKLVLAIGIAFVLPVFLVLLNFAGVISAKSIIGSWRWAILVIVLFTAIATPAADVVSMFLLALPMVVLYFAAWGVAWVHDRRAARRARAFEAELAL